MLIRARLHPLQSWLQDLLDYFKENARIYRQRQLVHEEKVNDAAKRLIRQLDGRNIDKAILEAYNDYINERQTPLERMFELTRVERPYGVFIEPVLRLAGSNIYLLLSPASGDRFHHRSADNYEAIDHKNAFGQRREPHSFLRILLRWRETSSSVVRPLRSHLDLIDANYPAEAFTAMLNDFGLILQSPINDPVLAS